VLRNRAELDQSIRELTACQPATAGLARPAGLAETYLPGNLADLIRPSPQQSGQRAVVLIDEYDKPILDNIETARSPPAMREGLKNLYSVLKGSDAHLKFVFHDRRVQIQQGQPVLGAE
jgi:hypothetical protein